MKNSNQFGAVVVTSPGDYLFAKGTCASLRHFMPDLPIALIVDGAINTKLLEYTYSVKVIHKSDIDHPWLRKHSFGWGITKMLAFWYSPFERFLYLDSDTLVWGDLRSRWQWEAFDYITDIPFHKNTPLTEEHVRTWFFEPQMIDKKFPEFPWRNYLERYACTGTFVARRNLFNIAEYQELLELNERYPWTFKFGEMGLLNLMIFRAHYQNRIKLGFADFQVIFPDFPMAEMQQRFKFEKHKPVMQGNDIQVLHMPDKKPLMNNPNCYSLPMTYFRLKFLNDSEGISGDSAIKRLAAEDEEYHRLHKQNLQRKRYNKLFRLITGHPGEWNSFMKRLSRHQLV